MTTASTWAGDLPPHRGGQDLRTRPDPVGIHAVDAVLIDGGLMHVRPVQPEDEAALLELHEHLSERSFYLRFFTVSPAAAPWFVHRVVRPPAADHAALVAEVGGQVVGLAAYERLDDPRDADFSIAVDDRQQGRGIGTLLLEHLVAKARAHGVQRFVGQILSDNVQMNEVFGDLGLAVHRVLRNGVVEVELALDDERYRAAIEEREARATVRSLVPLLRPRSVAVIGAGRTPRTVGHEVLVHLLQAGFTGAVYPVNPNAVTVAGRPAYASLADLPGPVDLAVVAVPAAAVPDTVRACGDCGVRAVVVLTAGFADAGARGASAQRALVTGARAAGMRLLGPNCLGVGNTAPDVRLDATFAPLPLPRGRVGVVTQSGGLGIGVLQQLQALGLGVSTFVSFGNKADVSANDLLLWYEHDDDTDLVVLYLESFGNPRKFARFARRIGRHRPVVAVKGGRSAAGTRGARSHTAAAAARPAVPVDALFTQSGVVAVDTLGELCEAVALLACQPLPSGPGVAVVSNAGGPGILAADAANTAGLTVPELRPNTQQALRALLPAAAAVANPVDTLAAVSGADFEQAIRLVRADPGVDALLAVVTSTAVTGPDELTCAVVAAAADTARKPLAAAILGQPRFVAVLTDPAGTATVPAYAFPEAAARALARAAAHARWRRRPAGRPAQLAGIDRVAARRLVDTTLAARPEGGWLPPEQAAALITAYGIPVAPLIPVDTAEAAAAAAHQLGPPVAVKAQGQDLVHKSDLGGVRLNLGSAASAAKAYQEMAGRLAGQMTGAVVQPMVPAGVEVVVGVVHDPAFGPLVMFGLGGVVTDLLADQAFRALPLTDVDAAELVRSIRAAPLLFGYRGAPAVDIAAIEDLVLRVACLADELPELAELDLNPIMATGQGAIAVDVAVRLAPAPATYDPYLRQLD